MAKERKADISHIMNQLNAGYIDITDTYEELPEFNFVKQAVIEKTERMKQLLDNTDHRIVNDIIKSHKGG